MVLRVNIREAPAKVKAYVAQHRLTFPHLLDVDARVASMLAVPGTPTTFLVDRVGQLQGSSMGYRDWASPAAYHVIESLLQSTP